ncbi:MAG: CsiV family protein [Pseudomonadota bacterium]
MNNNINHAAKSRRRRAALLMLALCWLLSTDVLAARWYHVEVIVFKQNQQEFEGGEEWSNEQSVPNFATAIDLSASIQSDEPISGIAPLSAGAYYLAGVYERLAASSRYEPLLHRAWAQPGYSANNVRQVYLSTDSNSLNDSFAPAGDIVQVKEVIEGTIGLQGGRLLHVKTNFVLRNDELVTDISEFRKIKLKQLHYFDHPLFGLLVRVTPFKRPASE